MIKNLKILNTRDIKKIKEILVKQFGYALTNPYVYLKNNKDKVFIVNRDISKINFDNLRTDRFGIYLGKIKNNQFRLSLEGTQLLFKEAKQNNVKLENMIELEQNQLKEYFKGIDLDYNLDENKLVILSYKGEILGNCSLKNKKLLNFMPKIHRGTVIV